MSSNLYNTRNDDAGFLQTPDYDSLMLANGYNYTLAKETAGGTAMSPAMQIMCFIGIGLCLSCCCVMCICMLIGDDENVNNLFKDDGPRQ